MKGFMRKLLAITLAISLCACSSAPKYQKTSYYQATSNIANMQVDSRCTNEVSFKQSSTGCPVIPQAELNGRHHWTDTFGAIFGGILIWGMIWFVATDDE